MNGETMTLEQALQMIAEEMKMDNPKLEIEVPDEEPHAMEAELAAARAEIAYLKEWLGVVIERGVEWHEWSCRSTHATGLACDCGGEELERAAQVFRLPEPPTD